MRAMEKGRGGMVAKRRGEERGQMRRVRRKRERKEGYKEENDAVGREKESEKKKEDLARNARD